MTIDIKIPEVGESIQEIQIGKWLKREGDIVERDENVVSLETDKASLDLPAPRRGVLKQILKQEGDTTTVGDVIARLEETDEATPKEADTRPASDGAASGKPSQVATPDAKKDRAPRNDQKSEHAADAMATPAARRALREHHLSMQDVRPEGGRIELSDVERFVESHAKDETSAKSSSPAPAERKPAQTPATFASAGQNDREVEASLESVVPMTLIRKRIAQRLVQAQQNAALLTTFNEIDMSGVLKPREQYGEKFKNRYGIKLGFMSFFVKAAVDALRLVPEINAEIRDNKIIYRNYYHIGIAIGSERGLVVPVLRFTERMSFAEIEQAIGEFARRANDNKLEPYDLEGGTFTISNGGVYGSLLSTPIVNPPQSGVLGLHSIQERPIAVAGEVVIRPMMYVALSYDHRIVDGREAVTFLRRIKDAVEDPARMIVEI